MTSHERHENWVLGQHEKAFAAFMCAVAEAQERLAELTAFFDDYMEYDPDEINWGHVGTATYF